MRTVATFGDSILDCARYNDHGVDPAGLLVANRDDLVPEFAGLDLTTRLGEVGLIRRAVDGATVDDLPSQLHGLAIEGPAIAIVTCGGNDLIRGFREGGLDVGTFIRKLARFLDALPIRPVYLGTVYDPTFGDDSTYGNILRLDDPSRARLNFQALNAALVALAPRYGSIVDIHAHFLTGSAEWYIRTIEPSLIGASEIRRCVLEAIDRDGRF
jgi:acyl-CoA thioesterase-1